MKPTYSQKELATIKKGAIPRHIAIIPDGNRRWAKQHLTSTIRGHHKGISSFIEIVHAAADMGIQTLTFYTFSTENWSRPKREVNALMRLLKTFLIEETPQMIEKGVRLHTIGELSALPADVQEEIAAAKEATKNNQRIDCILALNYGSRDEIRRSIHHILDDYVQNKIKREELTEEVISQYLDTAQWSDPELVIRTSGEQRISNFLLWQISYAELYLTKVLWPDFTPLHLLEAVQSYQKRHKRGGA